MPNFEVHLEGGIGPLPSEIRNVSHSDFNATTYDKVYPQNMTGSKLVGLQCPSCRSTLVKRVNGRDGRLFVACDKLKKPYCKFTIGLTETIGERTSRINSKLSQRTVNT